MLHQQYQALFIYINAKQYIWWTLPLTSSYEGLIVQLKMQTAKTVYTGNLLIVVKACVEPVTHFGWAHNRRRMLQKPIAISIMDMAEVVNQLVNDPEHPLYSNIY